MDRADQAAAILNREGLITGSTSGKMAHVHPAVRIEKDARAEFRRIWGQLSLDWNYQVDGR